MVAVHKNYVMPKDKNLYLPIFVGKDLHPDVNHEFQGDNTGENISRKNASYNELTAMYWGWKNLNADAVGLVHYRRYLSLHHGKSIDNILSESEVNDLLNSYDVILPKKRHYYIETNYSHYIHAHPKEELDLTRKIIQKKHPDYLEYYDEVMNERSAHMFNMFVMKQDIFKKYCEWLFDILDTVELELDTSKYDNYQSRVYGFISERLLDVWLKKNSIRYQEVNVIYLENQHWPSKIWKFLKRKILG